MFRRWDGRSQHKLDLTEAALRAALQPAGPTGDAPYAAALDALHCGAAAAAAAAAAATRGYGQNGQDDRGDGEGDGGAQQEGSSAAVRRQSTAFLSKAARSVFSMMPFLQAETPFCLQFFLCLARACLDKYPPSIFILKPEFEFKSAV